MNFRSMFWLAFLSAGILAVWADREQQGGNDRPGGRELRERDGTREHPEARRDEKPREGAEATLHQALRGRRGAEGILAFLLKEFQPELGEAERLARKHPEQAHEHIRGLVEHAAGLLEVQRSNPERYAKIMATRELETQSHELAERYRRAKGAEREQVGKQLTAALEKAFAARLAVRQEEVAEMAAGLKRQQQALAERKQNRGRIVQRRFEQLTRQGEVLEW